MNKLATVLVFMAAICSTATSFAQRKNQEYYQLSVYHCTTTDQLKGTEDYLGQALLPALHRAGFAKIGIFKPWGVDTLKDKTIYLLLSAPTLQAFADLPGKLLKDASYAKDGDSFINAPWDKPAFARLDITLLRAFSHAPVMSLPQLSAPKTERVYELRSYESYSEKIYRNKVHMFNEGGEVDLFARLKFNAIFYGDVIAGSRMPNLMYLTSYNNREDRDAHWKAFGSDPQWKELSARPEYQKNVSKIDISFLQPSTYSDY